MLLKEAASSKHHIAILPFLCLVFQAYTMPEYWQAKVEQKDWKYVMMQNKKTAVPSAVQY
jgi:hypothetical protein